MWNNRKVSNSEKTHPGALLTGLAVAFVARAPLGAATKQSEQNNKLLATTGPYEDLTEAALSGNAGKIKTALKVAEAERSATRALLAPEAAGGFDKLLAELNSAQGKNDTVAVARQSAELYKLLVSSLDSAALRFRTNALSKAANPDWTALRGHGARSQPILGENSRSRHGQEAPIGMGKAQQGLATAGEKRRRCAQQVVCPR